jgi:hypothetical protein
MEKLCALLQKMPNMNLAAKMLQIDHLPCFAHTLNLTVEDAIKNTPELESLFQKCRDVVGFFKRSTKAADQLRHEQNLRQEPQLN